MGDSDLPLCPVLEPLENENDQGVCGEAGLKLLPCVRASSEPRRAVLWFCCCSCGMEVHSLVLK